MAQTQAFFHAYEVTLNTASTPPTFTVTTGTDLVTSPGGEVVFTFASHSSLVVGSNVTAPHTSENPNAPSSLNYTGYAFNHDTFSDSQCLLMQDTATGKYYVLSGDPYTAGSTLPMESQSQIVFNCREAYCFFAGTLISTPEGNRPVETLQTGDVISTADGETRTVRWLGRQTVSAFFADAEKVLPIRIMAGAMGHDLPERDLLVSPDHALLVDGILVHASALINGRTIFQESDVPANFTYFHIETEDHALVLAEGTPAETFIDNVSRQAFDNWEEFEALYPNAAPMVELELPRVMWARQLPRIVRNRLEAVADRLLGKKAEAA